MRSEKRSAKSGAMTSVATSKKISASATIAKKISSRAKRKTTKRRANGSSAILKADLTEILTTRDRKKARLVRKAEEPRRAKNASASLKKKEKPEYRSKKKTRSQQAILAKL
jgi:hypothetical protein